MAFEDSGALFRNTRKEKDTHPDFQGELTISTELLRHLNAEYKAGRPLKLELSGWRKHSERAGDWTSLSAKKPWVKGGGTAAKHTAPRDDDDGDGLPF